MIVKFNLIVLCLLAATLHAQEQTDSEPLNYIEQEFRLPSSEAGPNGLDVLEVRVSGEVKRPLALITHGTSTNAHQRQTLTPWIFLPQALWFAQRGYVAIVVIRRGYGRSGGARDSYPVECTQDSTFGAAGEYEAADLLAAVKFMQRRPEVDPSTVVSLGEGTGGFAQLALAADAPRGLKAVISFEEGRRNELVPEGCNPAGLMDAFKQFGRKRSTPLLWVYTEEDHLPSSPEIVNLLIAAYEHPGSELQTLMIQTPPGDAREILRKTAAWSEKVETYLRSRDLLPRERPWPLPTPREESEPLGLGATGREAFAKYAGLPPYKAFAMDQIGYFGWSSAAFSQDIADRNAIKRCRKANPKPRSLDLVPLSERCVVVARTPSPV